MKKFEKKFEKKFRKKFRKKIGKKFRKKNREKNSGKNPAKLNKLLSSRWGVEEQKINSFSLKSPFNDTRLPHIP